MNQNRFPDLLLLHQEEQRGQGKSDKNDSEYADSKNDDRLPLPLRIYGGTDSVVFVVVAVHQ